MIQGDMIQITQHTARRCRVEGDVVNTDTRVRVLRGFSVAWALDVAATLRISLGARILVEGLVDDYFEFFPFLTEVWQPGERLVVEGATILLDYTEIRDAEGGPLPRVHQAPAFTRQSQARYRTERIAALAEALFTQGFTTPAPDREDAQAAIAKARTFFDVLEEEKLLSDFTGLRGLLPHEEKP